MEGEDEEDEEPPDKDDEQEEISTIASLLEDQLKQEKLLILSEKSLVAAVNEFVDKNEKEAISEWVKLLGNKICCVYKMNIWTKIILVKCFEFPCSMFKYVSCLVQEASEICVRSLSKDSWILISFAWIPSSSIWSKLMIFTNLVKHWSVQ